MPIQTNSDAWQEGTVPPSIEHQILDFLKENPDRAYNIREIMDELTAVDWEGYENQNRRREKLPEGEYLDESEEEDHPFLAYSRETNNYQLLIRSLVEKGLVDTKEIDADEFGDELPDEWEFVLAYTYHQSD